MELNAYQQLAKRTWNPPERDKILDINYLTLGVTNEAGEVAGKIKKVLRGDYIMSPDVKYNIAQELGDVLWYVSQLAQELGFDLDTIAAMNIAKLESRQIRNVLKGDGDKR